MNASELKDTSELVKAVFSVKAVSEFSISSKNEKEAMDCTHYLSGSLSNKYSVRLFEQASRNPEEQSSYLMIVGRSGKNA